MSEQKLAPCPKCPLCSEEMTDISQVAEKTMFECGNEDCDLVGVWITGERIDARPDLRRIAELEKINEEYRIKAQEAADSGQENEHARVIKEYKARIAELEATLLAIGEFGVKNPGCGFSCAKMAKTALRIDNTQPPTTP